MRLTRTVPVAALLFVSACTPGDAVSQAPTTTVAPLSVEPVSPLVPAPAAPSAEASGEPFSLYVHCGISTAEYAGRNWVVIPGTAPQVPARADAVGLSVVDGSIDGVMTQIGDDRLRFVAVDPSTGSSGAAIEFVPAAPPKSRCE